MAEFDAETDNNMAYFNEGVRAGKLPASEPSEEWNKVYGIDYAYSDKPASEPNYSYKNISGSKTITLNTFYDEPSELERTRFHRAVDDEYEEAE